MVSAVQIQIFRICGIGSHWLQCRPFAGDICIRPDRYRYNFHCNLPAFLPTSLEGNIGYIRYQARVVLDISWAPDEEFEDVFTVIKPLNLNYDPALRVSSTSLRHLCHCNGGQIEHWINYLLSSGIYLVCYSCQRSEKSTKHFIHSEFVAAFHRTHCIWWRAFLCPATRPDRRLTLKSMSIIRAKSMPTLACNWWR